MPEKKIKIPEIQAEREKTMLYQTCKHVLVMILYTLQVILECLIMYQNGHFVEFVLMAVCAVMVPVLVFAGILPTCLRRNGKGPDMEIRKFCFLFMHLCGVQILQHGTSSVMLRRNSYPDCWQMLCH